MESKTLKTIQTIMKIAKILSTIVFVFCIVGIVGCTIGIVTMALIGETTFEIAGVTLHSLIAKSADTSIGTVYTSMAVGLILCIGELIISKMAVSYFKHELEAGTPFTMDGAKELFRLGVCAAVISLGAFIAADITYAVMNKCFVDVADMHIEDSNQIVTGMLILFISLLCKLGAEKENPVKNEVE